MDTVLPRARLTSASRTGWLIVLGMFVLLACGGASHADTTTAGNTGSDAYGVTIAVTSVEPCELRAEVRPEGVQRTVTATLRVTNSGKRLLLFDSGRIVEPGRVLETYAEFNGEATQVMRDRSGSCRTDDESTDMIEPGRTREYAVTYAVGSEPGELTLKMRVLMEAEIVAEVSDGQ